MKYRPRPLAALPTAVAAAVLLAAAATGAGPGGHPGASGAPIQSTNTAAGVAQVTAQAQTIASAAGPRRRGKSPFATRA